MKCAYIPVWVFVYVCIFFLFMRTCVRLCSCMYGFVSERMWTACVYVCVCERGWRGRGQGDGGDVSATAIMMVGGGVHPGVWLLAVALAGAAFSSTPAAEISYEELLGVLTHLEETLQESVGCAGRMEKLWEAVRIRTAMLEDMKASVLKRMDQISEIRKNDSQRIEVCAETFTQVEGSCFHLYNDHLWQWWRSRFHCWILGGDLAQPDDLYTLRNLLQDRAGTTYWLGARTAPGLDSPEWRWVGGERMDPSHVTILPSLSQPANVNNCLMLETVGDYQLRAATCDEAHAVTLCEIKM
nr:uncharacterized protein LOC128689787 [Cherax quadricarinatus]